MSGRFVRTTGRNRLARRVGRAQGPYRDASSKYCEPMEAASGTGPTAASRCELPSVQQATVLDSLQQYTHRLLWTTDSKQRDRGALRSACTAVTRRTFGVKSEDPR
ncbi:hypothetical protein CERZMDRAFT_83234 [Cercospora zeae-maydis SCOH1-5]|uniref:Uncharacterized protein n=1 Tax=Cercospora zeae-maydis SCOH1-5 TaxID=717836 RepID=A0A6A6FK33_9PEZI|nr:hypothetical protein CERZMDRAFT_83234 [Cercospora zeae-maydis SCOH1-5]